ncbi:MAG: hypothetical protein IPK59_08385 [Rhodospirillaceae bacterium]|nr:hypothetical protein [Rhodospirillaceae bacterium]
MKPILIAACLMLVAGVARAEPGPMVTYLMNSTASDFTIGMLRLELALDKHANRLGENYAVLPLYDWEKNRINVWVWYNTKTDVDFISEKHCKEVVSDIRGLLGIKLDTGKPWSGDESFIGMYFTPIGYESKAQPKDLGKNLESDIAILRQGEVLPFQMVGDRPKAAASPPVL